MLQMMNKEYQLLMTTHHTLMMQEWLSIRSHVELVDNLRDAQELPYNLTGL